MPARFVRCPDTLLVRPLGPHTWLGRLPNGHELALLLPRPRPGPPVCPSAGDRVAVDISPADFSHGWILASEGDPGRHENRGPSGHDL